MYCEDAKKILQWLVYALQPLRCEELIDVLAVTSDENGNLSFHQDERLVDIDDLLLYCDGMLSIYELESSIGNKVRYVRLAHGSLKEYLLSLSEQSRFCMPRLACNIAMAEVCLSYLLSFDGLSKFPTESSIPPQSALTHYAATAWIHHMRIPGRPKTGPWDRVVSRFVSNRAMVLNWGYITLPTIAKFGIPPADVSEFSGGFLNDILHGLEDDMEALSKNKEILNEIEEDKNRLGFYKGVEFLNKLEDETFRERMKNAALDREKINEFIEITKLLGRWGLELDMWENELFCAYFIYNITFHEEESDEETEEQPSSAEAWAHYIILSVDTLKDEEKRKAARNALDALEKDLESSNPRLRDIHPTFTVYKRACFDHIAKIGCQMLIDRPHIKSILDPDIEVPDWNMNVDELRCPFYCMLFSSVVELLFVKDVEQEFDFYRQVEPGDAALSMKQTDSSFKWVDYGDRQQMSHEENTIYFGVIFEKD